MRLPFTLALLLLTASQCLEAVSIKGVVVENETNGRPLANVAITSVTGANQTGTDSAGRFTLEFPRKQPGDLIQLLVTKTGYVVVNDSQLRFTIPKDPDTDILVIILSAPQDRDEMARRHYHLASDENALKTYQRKAQEIHQDDAVASARILAELERARAALEILGDKVAKPTSDPSSASYQQAVSLFLGGKADAALKFLDEQKIGEALSSVHQRKAEVDKQVEGVVETFLLKARILTTLFRFDEAKRVYHEIAATEATSVEAWAALAEFSHGLREYPEALSAYTRALALSQTSEKTAAILVNRGQLYHELHRNTDAREDFEAALALVRQPSKTDEQNAISMLAVTLNNLGLLDFEEDRLDEASEELEETIAIYQTPKLSPQGFIYIDSFPELAAAFSNIGNVHRNQLKGDQALDDYQRSLRIRRSLAETHREAFLPDVAISLNNIGTLLLGRGQIIEARGYLSEALEVRREFAHIIPQRYTEDVAGTLGNLGRLNLADQRIGDAADNFQEALKLRRDLARQTPEAFLPGVVSSLRDLANLHRDTGKSLEAAAEYQEALEICHSLTNRDSARFQPTLAATLLDLGTFHRLSGRSNAARDAYQEALSIYRNLAKERPRAYLPALAAALDKLGELDLSDHQQAGALLNFVESLLVYRNLAKDAPAAYLPQVAWSLIRLGRLHLDQGRLEEARWAFWDAITIYQTLPGSNPDNQRSAAPLAVMLMYSTALPGSR